MVLFTCVVVVAFTVHFPMINLLWIKEKTSTGFEITFSYRQIFGLTEPALHPPIATIILVNDIISQKRFINLKWTVYACIQGVDDDSKAD